MDEQTETVLNFAEKTLQQTKEYFTTFEGVDVTKIAYLMLNITNALHKIECLKQLERLQRS